MDAVTTRYGDERCRADTELLLVPKPGSITGKVTDSVTGSPDIRR